MQSEQQGTKARCPDTVPRSTLAVAVWEWNLKGPIESSSQHQLGGELEAKWQNRTLLNLSYVQKMSVWKQDTEVARGFCLRKSYTGCKSSALQRLSELHKDTNSLEKMNSEGLLTTFHKTRTRRNPMKSGSMFGQANALYFYVLEVYIIQPIATLCLDFSSLKTSIGCY